MPVLDTPIVKKAHPDGNDSDELNARKRATCIRYALDAVKFCVGPMPPKEFLNTFFPKGKSGIPSHNNAFKKVPTDATTASEMHESLATHLSASPKKSRCPGYEFAVTASNGGPALCMYSTADRAKASEAHLGFAQMFVEVRTEDDVDFFTDPPPGVCRREHNFVLATAKRNYDDAVDAAQEDQGGSLRADERKAMWQEIFERVQEDLGLNVYYAVEIFRRQHRTCLYSISLFGGQARLIRWDRAGAVATEAFDIKKQPEFLYEFLWRFSHASDAQRGHDTTVTLATKEEEELFERVVTEHVRIQLALPDGNLNKRYKKTLEKAVEEHYEQGKVICISVLEKEGTTLDKIHKYLVSRPVVLHSSIGSRATKGYWAASVETQRIAFLKDTWRHNHDRANCEGDIHGRLAQADVKNIPEGMSHCTLHPSLRRGNRSTLYQASKTDDFIYQEWACNENRSQTVSLSTYIHYRIVFGTVGYPLERLEGVHDLLHGTFDAFEAMVDAFKKAEMLHRDVSVNNMMLVRENARGPKRGFLIDWELACPIAKGNNPPHKNERVGTWDFMSVRLIKAGDFVHSIQDDMESMLYVVLYCALKWLPHNLKPRTLGDIMYRFFEFRATYEDGSTWGADEKYSNQGYRTTTRRILFECSQLEEWLAEAMQYNAPFGSDTEKAQFAGKWESPDHLHAFWANFLDTKKLPKKGRKDNGIEYL